MEVLEPDLPIWRADNEQIQIEGVPSSDFPESGHVQGVELEEPGAGVLDERGEATLREHYGMHGRIQKGKAAVDAQNILHYLIIMFMNTFWVWSFWPFKFGVPSQRNGFPT